MSSRQRKITDIYKSAPRQNKTPTIHDSQEAGPSGLCKYSSANKNKKKTSTKRKANPKPALIDSSDVDSDDVLLENFRKNKLNTSSNKLPSCLSVYQLISPSGYEGSLDLKVSTYCVKEFKRLTNIDERIDKHLEFLNKTTNQTYQRYNGIEHNYIKSFYTNTRKKLHYPYNGIKFDSPEAEVKLKMLVSYPQISSDILYMQYKSFLNSNDVKECHVDLSENNLVQKSVQNFFKNKLQKGVKEWHLSLYRNSVNHQILVDYYNLSMSREIWYLQEISLEKLCEISNFEEILEEFCRDLNLSEEEFNEKLKRYFQYLKRPVIRYQKPVFNNFKVYPKYELNWNVITTAQEKFLTQSLKHFRLGTNIEAILKESYKNSRIFHLDAEIEKLYKLYCEDPMCRKSGIFSDLLIINKIYTNGLPPEEENQEMSRNKTLISSPNVLSQQNKQNKIQQNSPAKTPFSLLDHMKNQKKNAENSSQPVANKTNKKLPLKPIDLPKKKIPGQKVAEKPETSTQQKPFILRKNPNNGKRKLPEFLRGQNMSDSDTGDEILLQNINRGVEEEENVPAPDMEISSSEPLVCNGEIIMESMAAIFKRTGTSNIQNPVIEENVNEIPNNTQATRRSQHNNTSTELEALLCDSPKVIKLKILHKLKTLTNILIVVKIHQQRLLKENFTQLWNLNKKKYFLDYTEKKIFTEKPDFTAIKFKEDYSEDILIRELNVYFLVKTLETAENEPNRNTEVAPNDPNNQNLGNVQGAEPEQDPSHHQEVPRQNISEFFFEKIKFLTNQKLW